MSGGGSQFGQAASYDQSMAGSDEALHVTETRTQIPAVAPSSAESDNPRGLLQTIMRSAKDDLKIVGNVFKHLTGA